MPRSTSSTAFWSVACVLVAALALLQFSAQAILWFLPYHLAGFANELGLLLLGLAIGALIARVLARRSMKRPARRSGFAVGLALYVAASFAMLGWSPQTGLAVGAHRYTLFSTPECEFAARFPGPANSGRLRGDVFEKIAGEAPQAAVAIYADLPSLTALRADCLPIAGAGAADKTALAATAARQWAKRIGIEVTEERLDRNAQDATFRLRGMVRGSVLPQEAGGTNRTLAAIDSHIGERSIMTLYVFQPDTGALSSLAIEFLAGVRRR